jgi:hypothetical protein
MSARLQHLLAVLRRNDGSSIVELQVSFGILAAFLFGMCQISVAMYAYQFTSDAARQATRWAMVRGNSCHTNTPNLSTCSQVGGATAAQIQTYVQTLNYPAIRTASVRAVTVWCQASTSNPSSTNATSWTSCSSTTSNAPGNLVKVTVTYPLSFQIPFSRNMSLTVGSTSQMVITQ